MDGDNGSSLEHGDYGRSGLFSGSNLSRHGAVRRRGSDRPDPDHLLQRRNTRDAERRLAYSNFNDSGSHGFCE
jgi:hypothetical protein